MPPKFLLPLHHVATPIKRKKISGAQPIIAAVQNTRRTINDQHPALPAPTQLR